MICFTNDTPLRRAEKYKSLLEKLFEHIHSMSTELSAFDESKIQEFEEEFIQITNPSPPEKLPDADDRTFQTQMDDASRKFQI